MQLERRRVPQLLRLVEGDDDEPAGARRSPGVQRLGDVEHVSDVECLGDLERVRDLECVGDLERIGDVEQHDRLELGPRPAGTRLQQTWEHVAAAPNAVALLITLTTSVASALTVAVAREWPGIVHRPGALVTFVAVALYAWAEAIAPALAVVALFQSK